MDSPPRIRCEHLIFAPVVSFIDSSHVGACKIFKNAISHFLLPFQHSRTGPIWSGLETGRRGQCLTPVLPFSAEDELPALTVKQVAVAQSFSFSPLPQWIGRDFAARDQFCFPKESLQRLTAAGQVLLPFQPISSAISPRSSAFP